jgi:N-succinyldiaminopimelate aminotransferase
MKPLNPTFAGLGTTIFTVMSGLANQHGAINLGQGFPDTDGPLALRERAAQALIEGPNQYPPMMGVEALRQALAAHAKRFYDLTYDWRSEVVVTSGGTEALTASIMGLVNPGDEVILFEPAYDSYKPIVEAVGGVAKPIRLAAPNWTLTAQALAAAFSTKTKAVLLNSPMNPAGKVFSAAELELLATFLKRFDALAICDEVYEHLTFDGVKHTPLATLPGMYERCVCRKDLLADRLESGLGHRSRCVDRHGLEGAPIHHVHDAHRAPDRGGTWPEHRGGLLPKPCERARRQPRLPRPRTRRDRL